MLVPDENGSAFQKMSESKKLLNHTSPFCQLCTEKPFSFTFLLFSSVCDMKLLKSLLFVSHMMSQSEHERLGCDLTAADNKSVQLY